MKRADLEHIIRAAGTIANCTELIVVGSQSILGAFPNPPPELTVSQEADTWPANDPGKADLIDGSIGEKSPFHDTFGYYAHGVAPETPVLAAQWKQRLIPIENANTNGITGLCLSPADLAISKLAAGREKDLLFVAAMLRHKLILSAEIEALLSELNRERADLIQQRLTAITRRAQDSSNPG